MPNGAGLRTYSSSLFQKFQSKSKIMENSDESDATKVGDFAVALGQPLT
jgi:hypothetical protein